MKRFEQSQALFPEEAEHIDRAKEELRTVVDAWLADVEEGHYKGFKGSKAQS